MSYYARLNTPHIPKADGCYGRRHNPRNLWGFWHPPVRRMPKEEETQVEERRPCEKFIGYKIVKAAK